MSKDQLRNDALLRRHSYASALWPATRNTLERQLAQIVLPRLIGARVIAAYHPMKDEISPYTVLDAIGPEQRAALPWFADRDSKMMFREGPATESGPWNVLQPSSEADVMAPDIVLVPVVLADRQGNRIGHGKGHYDRALAHLREGGHSLRTIGIAWEHQVAPEPIPADPWDQPLDAIATPGEWIQCK